MALGTSLLLLGLGGSALAKTFKFVNTSPCSITVQYYYYVRYCGGAGYGWFPQYGPCSATLSAYATGDFCVPLDCSGGFEVTDVNIVWIFGNDNPLNDTAPHLFSFSTFGENITLYLNCNGIERVSATVFDDRDFPPDPECQGMPVWRVTDPFLSVWLVDEPLGYQAGLGPPISFRLAYKQRESVGGLDPAVFGTGKNWNCSWLSFVAPGWRLGAGTFTDVYFAGGGRSTFNGTTLGGTTTYATDHVTHATLSGNTNSGFTVSYPEGRKDVFGFIVTNASGAFLKAFLTERWTATGQRFTLSYDGYNPANPVVRLRQVIDGDGRTNAISYVSSNNYSTNLISSVTDPCYG